MRTLLNHSWLLIIIFLVACKKDEEPAPPRVVDGIRYSDDIFLDIDETINVKFGENKTLNGISRNLSMNIYQPLGDELEARPVVLLAHGGGFVSGSKFDLTELCESYAKKGFVAASMDYRTIDKVVSDSVAFSEEIVLAIGDMKAAIRQLREDAASENPFKINPNQIFVGGISAGAVIASHIGYLDEWDAIPSYFKTHLNEHGGLEGNTNSLNQSSRVQGVISFSGSLIRDYWIDEGEPPLFMVHEELDPVVPCGYASSALFPFPIFSYGACSMQQRANEMNITNQFILYEGIEGHVDYLQNEDAEEIVKASAEFIKELIQ